MEIVWQKVKDDARSKELGLVKETEDEEELRKWKQRLTDKVRQEMRRAIQRKKWCQKKRKHIAFLLLGSSRKKLKWTLLLTLQRANVNQAQVP